MKARAFDGEGAADALRTFAECFCLPNTFHANGDQTKSGKSKFTYRPFTLEGNFAFAAGGPNEFLGTGIRPLMQKKLYERSR